MCSVMNKVGSSLFTLHCRRQHSFLKIINPALPANFASYASTSRESRQGICYFYSSRTSNFLFSYFVTPMPLHLSNGLRYSWAISSLARCSTKTASVQAKTPVKFQVAGENLGAKPAEEGHYKLSRSKSQATLMYLVALVVAMVGCTYAAVPLYRKFCQATGYGGTIRRLETVEEKIARHAHEDTETARQLVVHFNADVADGMPLKFTPTQYEVRVKPGQSTLAFYTVENLSSYPVTGVSTYNVTPMKAGIYFNKIQCFCFEEQRLLPGEKIDMPVEGE
eukprot:c17447_g1_i1 orf=308-1144(-)